MKSLFALSALCLTVLVLAGIQEAQSLPSFTGALSCARDYMAETVKQKLVSRSALVARFYEKMEVAKQRYRAAQQAGLQVTMDELLLEELRGLRREIESRGGKAPNDGLANEQMDPALLKCVDPDALHEGWSPAAASAAMEDEEEEDETSREHTEELKAELERLQTQASREAEMGWSLDPETKAALASRTKSIVAELLNNEVRQLALAVVQSYLTGGSLAPVILTITATLRFKLADYFMNGIMDVVSSLLGKRIEIKPVGAGAQPIAVPVAA